MTSNEEYNIHYKNIVRIQLSDYYEDKLKRFLQNQPLGSEQMFCMLELEETKKHIVGLKEGGLNFYHNFNSIEGKLIFDLLAKTLTTDECYDILDVIELPTKLEAVIKGNNFLQEKINSETFFILQEYEGLLNFIINQLASSEIIETSQSTSSANEETSQQEPPTELIKPIKDRLSHAQIALIYIYNGVPITEKTNATEIARTYKWTSPTSGKALSDKYIEIGSKVDRVGAKDLRKMVNDIELILPLLTNERAKTMANNERIEITKKLTKNVSKKKQM